jgi:bifunctional DNA-binding transcriptional regulator/antitoxin component of YhaV-PrlF toxin-antitoxin module
LQYRIAILNMIKEQTMTYTSTVAENGETKLPTALRESLGIRVGDTIEYEMTEQGVQLRVKRPDVRATVAQFSGMLHGSTATTKEEALAEFRALRGRDDEEQAVLERWAAE